MNLFSNLRISHKISALMIGLIFGFIVIGVTYYVQIQVESKSMSNEQDSLGYRNQLAALNLSVEKISSAVNNYLNAPTLELEQSLQKSIADAETTIQTNRQGALNDEQRNTWERLQQQLSAFGGALQSVTEKQNQIGYDNDSGANSDAVRRGNSLNALLVQMDQAPLFNVAKTMAGDASTLSGATQNFADYIGRLDIPTVAEENLASNFERFAEAVRRVNDFNRELNAQALELIAKQSDLSNGVAQVLANSYSVADQTIASNLEQRQIVQAAVTAIIFAVAMGTAVGVYFLYKSIVFPMVHMQSVIGKINRGKTGTRVKVLSNDELGDLGKAFNQLLDERIKQLEERSHENDQLNNSIISLIRALGVIAQKDLTIKVPVSPDITGTISDAVNLLTKETAKTLQDVKLISEQVNGISDNLQEQSSLVMEYAEGEKRQIIATSKALEVLARAMNEVAVNAEKADINAAKAIQSTQQARQSVEETVGGIRAIRETISETEKRTKRLGDRSQEISGIVNLINTIAERTHILALNASMHAASAGEAGRGFAVVADEVQRLAESARHSTDEISSMVNNMRVETSDTVAIMSKLISQVAEGSHLAELAGKRMADTEAATQELVTDVKNISQQAVQQAEIANRVRDRSGIIRKFSEKTGQQLLEQKHQTDSLKQYADTLVEQVNVFTLPESLKTTIQLAPPKTSSVAVKPATENQAEEARETDTISRLKAAG